MGSLVYSIGGFGLPFWLVGGIALVASVLIFIFVPNVEASQDESSKGSKSLRLLSIAKVFYNFCMNSCHKLTPY